MMSETIHDILKRLLQNREGETLEFKEAARNYKSDKIGRYFSALANEANLAGKTQAWLVFGVHDHNRTITGTKYRQKPGELQALKQDIGSETAPNMTFREIHEVDYSGQRVVMMEIPAAPQGLPIAWKGHYYGRAGESLAPLDLAKLDAIRAQTRVEDWSAQIISGDLSEYLDEVACVRAREIFLEKYSKNFSENDVKAWSLATLLDRLRVTQSGQLTRTALLLLGRPESAHLLSPHPAQITWRLSGAEKAYEHFKPPFLLRTTELFRRIRNFQVRLLPANSLLPYEVMKYDAQVVLEAMHNCIAHQDYRRNARVLVTEYPDRLTFANEGGFFDGAWEDYVDGQKTPLRYRNTFLVQAMQELKMIDTMGFGIHRMFKAQRERYLPLPDFLVSEERVCLTIHSQVVDPAYTQLLMENAELSLHDVLALDRVQKQLPIPNAVARQLRRARLIEGRKPNYHVSASVAEATSTKASYIRMQSLDNRHYQELIIEYIRRFGSATRQNIDELIWDKLGDGLTERQKADKVGNLLRSLRQAGKIENRGTRRHSAWHLLEPGKED